MVIFTATLATPRMVTIMWILKYSKDLIEYMQTYNQGYMSSCNNIQSFNFSTIYTTTCITHSKLNEILKYINNVDTNTLL